MWFLLFYRHWFFEKKRYIIPSCIYCCLLTYLNYRGIIIILPEFKVTHIIFLMWMCFEIYNVRKIICKYFLMFLGNKYFRERAQSRQPAFCSTPAAVTHGVRKWCRTWHRIVQCYDNPMPCLASFFYAMSGVKKLLNFVPAINFPTSAYEPSIL